MTHLQPIFSGIPQQINIKYFFEMKNFKLILTLLLSSFVLNSCLVDDEDQTLDAMSSTPYTIGFASSSANESLPEDIGPITKQYPVVIIGGKDGSSPTSDIEITYVVDQEASTATEGVEFDFVESTGKLTIPAGSDFVNFPLIINTGNLDKNQPSSLVLNLTGTSSSGEKSVIASVRESITITFVGCNSSVDQFTYLVTTTVDAGGAVETNQLETITKLDVNTFRTATVGPFGPGARRGDIGGTNGFTFTDVCGNIVIENQNLVDLYSNEVYGSGTVDPETGNITFKYAITFGGTPTFYTSTFVKQ